MSRRLRQGIKDIEKDIADFERSVQNVKASRNKSVDHNSKYDRQLKPFVTEPIREVVPRVRQKSKAESREIHKQVLENKNATVVITVRTKHSQVSKRRSKVNESPRRSTRDEHSVPKESNTNSEITYKEAASVNRDRNVKGLPWSSLLNNKKGDYETCSSIYSISSQPKNMQSARSTTESKYVYKNNCSTFSQRHDFELKARVDQSVQCPLPQCECGKTDPIGELKSLFTDVLNTLQKSQGKDNVERNLNKERSSEDEEPVRLSPKSNSEFIPLHPAKSSPANEISAPVPILPTVEEKSDTTSSCGSNVVCAPVPILEAKTGTACCSLSQSNVISATVSILPTLEEKTHRASSSPPDMISPPLEEKRDTATSSPGSMHKQLEVTNLLLEQTYRNIAFKCEEYRKERDQLREEVIQQQKKVEALMEKEKDHLLVINSLQADIHGKAKMFQHPCRTSPRTECCTTGSSRRNSELENEIQFLRQQSEKYEALMAHKEKELARFRQELQNIQAVIQEQLENCKLIQYKTPPDGLSFERKEGQPVCSSPTSSVVTLGTLESWQKISCISPSTDAGHDSGSGVILREKLRSPKRADTFRSTILEATAAISDNESIKKAKSELSKVFEEIRNLRLPLPSPPRTYTDLSDSRWTDLSVGTPKNGSSVNDSRLTRSLNDSRLTEGLNDSRLTEGLYDSRLTQGPKDSRLTEGFYDSRLTQGPKDSRLTEGLYDSRLTQGPKDSRLTEGLYDRRLTQGPKDSRLTEGLNDSRLTEGLYDRRLMQGPKDSRQTEGLYDSRFTQGPKDSRLTEGLKDSRLTEGLYDNRLTEGLYDNRLTEGLYDNRLTEGPKDSRLTEGPKDSRLTEGPKDSRLTEGPKDSRLTDGPKNSRLTESPKDSRLTDGPKNSRLTESPKDSRLTEGLKNSRLTGGLKNSRLTGSLKDSRLTESPKNSRLTESPKNSRLTGGLKDSRLTESPRDSRLTESPKDSRTQGPKDSRLTQGPKDSRLTQVPKGSRLTQGPKGSRLTQGTNDRL